MKDFTYCLFITEVISFKVIVKPRVLWKRLTTETSHQGNASKTAFEESPFYFRKSFQNGKG